MTPPDNISEAIERLQDGMKRAKEHGWEASVLRHKYVETLIQAATPPAAEVTVEELNTALRKNYKGLPQTVGEIMLDLYAGRAIIITADNQPTHNEEEVKC